MSDVTTPMATLAADVEGCLATRTIAAIKGPAGVGKSEMVRAIARRLGVRLFTLIGSLADPTDINGFPVVAQGRRMKSHYTGRDHPVLEFAPREWMVEANDSTEPTAALRAQGVTRPGAVIFLDELTSAPPPVKAAMLHLLTQWEAGDFKLDPDLVGFVTAFNDADEAVNGSELGFPMVNRLTHFTFPMGPEAVREWCGEFPGYWGFPKPVTYLGRAVPEEHLIRARSAIAGYLRREPNNWHYRLLEAVSGGKDGDKRKGGKEAAPSAGTHPQAGAVTPRSWDRVARHLAYASAAGLHPLTVLRRVVGEIGEGAAASFEVYLQQTALPDPEALLAAPKAWRPTGRLDTDFAIVMAVTAAVRSVLTPERYEAAWQILHACADQSGTGSPAFEAGAAGVLQLQQWISHSRSGELIGGLDPHTANKYMVRIQALTAPYEKIGQAIRGKSKT